MLDTPVYRVSDADLDEHLSAKWAVVVAELGDLPPDKEVIEQERPSSRATVNTVPSPNRWHTQKILDRLRGKIRTNAAHALSPGLPSDQVPYVPPAPPPENAGVYASNVDETVPIAALLTSMRIYAKEIDHRCGIGEQTSDGALTFWIWLRYRCAAHAQYMSRALDGLEVGGRVVAARAVTDPKEMLRTTLQSRRIGAKAQDADALQQMAVNASAPVLFDTSHLTW